MKWKREIIGIGISLICTILIAMLCSKFITLENLILACIPIFFMFLIIILSIYALINKVAIKTSILLLSIGVNGSIMVLSAILSSLICFIISIILFVVLIVVGFRLKDKE